MYLQDKMQRGIATAKKEWIVCEQCFMLSPPPFVNHVRIQLPIVSPCRVKINLVLPVASWKGKIFTQLSISLSLVRVPQAIKS